MYTPPSLWMEARAVLGLIERTLHAHVAIENARANRYGVRLRRVVWQRIGEEKATAFEAVFAFQLLQRHLGWVT